MRTPSAAPWVLLSVLGAAMVGCSGGARVNPGPDASAFDGAGPDDDGGDRDVEVEAGIPTDVEVLDGAVSCATDPRVDTYTAGLTKLGAKGLAQVEVVSADPAPPARYGNSWAIQVLDPSGAPLASIVTVDEKMPDHGHGTSIRPKITPGDTGAFTVDPLYLFMPGVWRIQFDVFTNGAPDAGPPLDTVTFFFCIDG